eukprot:9878202-Ditylum_brightwellii.AAC.1
MLWVGTDVLNGSVQNNKQTSSPSSFLSRDLRGSKRTAASNNKRLTPRVSTGQNGAGSNSRVFSTRRTRSTYVDL